jgi:hypothetical protein
MRARCLPFYLVQDGQYAAEMATRRAVWTPRCAGNSVPCLTPVPLASGRLLCVANQTCIPQSNDRTAVCCPELPGPWHHHCY